MIAKTDIFIDAYGKIVDGNDIRATSLVVRAGKLIPQRYIDAVRDAEKPVKESAPKATKEAKPRATKSAK